MTPDHTTRERLELSEGGRLFVPGADDGTLPGALAQAERDAEAAYDAWRASPSVDAYVSYLAAEDRVAAAEDEIDEISRAGRVRAEHALSVAS